MSTTTWRSSTSSSGPTCHPSSTPKHERLAGRDDRAADRPRPLPVGGDARLDRERARRARARLHDHHPLAPDDRPGPAARPVHGPRARQLDPVLRRRAHVRPLPGAVGVSVGDVAVAVLLGLGVASALMGALGILTTRNPYDQLHFTGPATVVGPVTIAAAVLVEEPFSSAGIKAVVVALIMVGTGPILLH